MTGSGYLALIVLVVLIVGGAWYCCRGGVPARRCAPLYGANPAIPVARPQGKAPDAENADGQGLAAGPESPMPPPGLA